MKRDEKGRFTLEGDGVYIDSKGYPSLTCGPLRGMRVHKLVALAKFGKAALDPRNVVHHKDNDKLNPHPDNLELKTPSEHNAITAKQYHYLKNNVWPKEKADWDAYFAEANGHSNGASASNSRRSG
jgi:hypothetical protein